MARTGSARHTHKYFRLVTDGLWHCALPNCSHFMPGNMPPPVYKHSVCWGCGNVFELNPDNMRDMHPVCRHCPPFDVAPTTDKPSEMGTLDDISAFIEMKEREARMKRLKEPEPELIETETAHTAECASWLGADCDCM